MPGYDFSQSKSLNWQPEPMRGSERKSGESLSSLRLDTIIQERPHAWLGSGHQQGDMKIITGLTTPFTSPHHYTNTATSFPLWWLRFLEPPDQRRSAPPVGLLVGNVPINPERKHNCRNVTLQTAEHHHLYSSLRYVTGTFSGTSQQNNVNSI